MDKKELIDLFTQLNFIVQPLSFNDLEIEESFKKTLQNRYPDEVVTQFLKAFPDLFIINQSAEPENSAILIYFDIPSDPEKVEVMSFTDRKIYIYTKIQDGKNRLMGKFLNDLDVEYHLSDLLEKLFDHKFSERQKKLLSAY